MELVLASGSPYRSRILTEFGFPHRVFPANIDEDLCLEKYSPADFVMQLAKQKAHAVASQFPGNLILGCDTMVVNAQGKLLGKPHSRKQAQEFLAMRSGASEEVITGFYIHHGDTSQAGYASSQIWFKDIPLKFQEKLLTTGEWEGVCGGLKIEGAIAPYVLKIRGDMCNIMGLPMPQIAPLIKSVMNHA